MPCRVMDYTIKECQGQQGACRFHQRRQQDGERRVPGKLLIVAVRNGKEFPALYFPGALGSLVNLRFERASRPGKKHHPGIDPLRLPPDHAAPWRARLQPQESPTAAGAAAGGAGQPALVSGHLHALWVYVLAPVALVTLPAPAPGWNPPRSPGPAAACPASRASPDGRSCIRTSGGNSSTMSIH